MRALSLLVLASLLAGAPADAARVKRGPALARRAARLVGVQDVSKIDPRVPDDCTGLVRAVYARAGIDLVRHGSRPGENGVTTIWRLARSRKAVHKRAPRPGDLIFFRETYDRNRDGELNDGITHVGIVERLRKDGTVTFIHRGSKGVMRSQMNLRRPREHLRARGRVRINDYIRAPQDGHRGYLTSELFVGYASPERL